MIARVHRMTAATLIALAVGATAPARAQDLEAANYPNRPRLGVGSPSPSLALSRFRQPHSTA